MDFSLYYNATQYKEKYDYYVSICKNLELMEEYGLEAHAGITYCYSDLEDKTPDVYDWAFVVTIGIVLLILLSGTVLDVFLNKSQVQKHYEESVSKYSKSLSFVDRSFLKFVFHRIASTSLASILHPSKLVSFECPTKIPAGT